MRTVSSQTKTFYRTTDIVWHRLVEIHVYGHLWLPAINSCIKKSINEGISEGDLFEINGSAFSKLCTIEQFFPKSQITLCIANKFYSAHLQFILLEDANATQVTLTISLKAEKYPLMIRKLIEWIVKKSYENTLSRLERIIVMNIDN